MACIGLVPHFLLLLVLCLFVNRLSWRAKGQTCLQQRQPCAHRQRQGTTSRQPWTASHGACGEHGPARAKCWRARMCQPACMHAEAVCVRLCARRHAMHVRCAVLCCVCVRSCVWHVDARVCVCVACRVFRGVARITFLGTASSQPSKYRNVTALYLDCGPSRGGMLLDCGEDTLGQMKRVFGVEGGWREQGAGARAGGWAHFRICPLLLFCSSAALSQACSGWWPQ